MDNYLITLNYPASDIRAIEMMVEESDLFSISIECNENASLSRILTHLDPNNTVKIKALLDMHLYSDLTTLATSSAPIQVRAEKCLRTSAALLAFLQIAEIDIDYGICLYEYADSNQSHDAVAEYRAFERIDNCDPLILIDFALGRINSVSEHCLMEEQPPLPIKSDEFSRKLRLFRIAYTVVLKIVDLRQSKNMTNHQRILALLDWMYEEFSFLAVSLVFANRLFSPNRFSKMLKSNDRRSVRNAAWDIFLVMEWLVRTKAAHKNDVAFLLCSRDRAVKDCARVFLGESREDLKAHFIEAWGKKTSHGNKIWDRYCHYEHLIATGERREIPIKKAAKILTDLEKGLGT